MEYKTGSYLIKGRKEHKCEYCKLRIGTDAKHLARVKEYGETFTRKDGSKFRQKDYIRFHIGCAIRLYDITDFERGLINK